MGSTFGDQIKLSIFGESHGPSVGMVLEGLEEGIVIDEILLERELKRRSPGRSLTSPRREKDKVIFLSGIYQGRTLPSPITAMVHNTAAKDKDYQKLDKWMRPSHADYPAFMKYHGLADMRGGGHFSGRLTLGLVIAGALCKMALMQHEPFHKSYGVGSHITQLYTYQEPSWRRADKKLLLQRNTEFLPSEDPKAIEKLIEGAKKNKDSLGGIVETFAIGLPAGLGEPFFDSLESKISHLLFSIPAVKGVLFGIGEQFASLTGSKANDPYYISSGKVKTLTNHNGGILGGISTGMPLVVRTVVKPTPSIGLEQKSVDMKSGKMAVKTISGQHDPCIVPRAIPVIESCIHIALYDAFRANQFRTKA